MTEDPKRLGMGNPSQPDYQEPIYFKIDYQSLDNKSLRIFSETFLGSPHHSRDEIKAGINFVYLTDLSRRVDLPLGFIDRNEFVDDVQFGLASQLFHFQEWNPNSEQRKKASLVTSLSLDVLWRVRNHVDNEDNDLFVGESQLQRETEFLEVIRRDILHPSYFLVGGRSGELSTISEYNNNQFFHEQVERLKEVFIRQSMSGRPAKQVQKEMNMERVASLTSQDWNSLIEKEETQAVDLLKTTVKSATESEDGIINFAKGLGKKLAPEVFVAELEKRRAVLTILESDIGKKSSLNEIALWIKKQFGDEATFDSLLSLLYPAQSDAYFFSEESSLSFIDNDW